MWTNKHVIVALLVAPVLAVMAWFGVDAIVAERAEPAQPGKMYPLIAKPSCRRPGGNCELTNNEFELTIRVTHRPADKTALVFESNYTLSGVVVSLHRENTEIFGIETNHDLDTETTQRVLTIPSVAHPSATLRIAVHVEQSIYFAELPAVFLREDSTTTE